MLKFQLNIRFSEITKKESIIDKLMVARNITGETSLCVSGKTSNMLDNGIARKNSLGHVNTESQN